MLIERESPFSHSVNELEIDVTPEQLKAWEDGECIQNVMPHLTPDEREFLMTGITEDEWDETFNEPIKAKGTLGEWGT